MALPISTVASKMAASAAGVATQMGGTTTGEAATVAAIMKVLSQRQDILHQILKLVPLSTNSGANAIKPE